MVDLPRKAYSRAARIYETDSQVDIHRRRVLIVLTGHRWHASGKFNCDLKRDSSRDRPRRAQEELGDFSRNETSRH